MPAHIVHLIIDQLVLGREYPEVHKYMDSMQPYMQSKHREFLHDQATVREIAMLDIGAGYSAMLHIMLDSVSDIVGQEKSVPALLEMLRRG